MNCKSFSKAGFALILILSIEHTNAQKVKPCSAVRMREHLFRNNPAAKKTFDSTQLVLKTKMQERTSQPNFPGAPYRIQTVVHVLGTTANTQPSDADIRTMIASINENLAGQDPDLINLPFAFTDNLAGNTGIELCLTDIDPNGFPTDGIIRHVTTRDDYYIEYGVNQVMSAADPAMGGIVIWDRNKYLNILITPTLFDTVGLPGQRVGVSSFPGYPANRDCYVVRRPNMLEDGAHTHELGHWLNLKHIWGDDDGDADALNDGGRVDIHAFSAFRAFS